MKKITALFLTICGLCENPLKAQDLTGMLTSNYGGLYRATYNPSVLGGSRYKWQFNVGTINSSITNRYFLYFGRNSMLYPSLASRSTKELYGRSRTMGSITNDGPIHLVSDFRLPSLMISLNKKHGVALQVRSRGFVQGDGIPADIKMLYTKRLDTPKEGTGEGDWGDFRLKQHSFSEIAMSYGVQLLDEKDHKFRAGITVKRIMGGRTSFIEGNVARYRYEPIGNSSENQVILQQFRYAGGQTNPVDKVGPFGLLDGSKYAQGWGLDMGISYELGSRWFRDSPEDSTPGYVLRLAASVNDVGKMNYKTETSSSFAGNRDQWVMQQAALETIADFGPEGLRQLLGGTDGKVVRGSGRLPAMYHLEADVQLFKTFFVTAASSRRLYKDDGGVLDITQPNHFTITPRWENEDSDYAFPIAFIEGKKKVSIGLAARMGPVHVGFSNFLGLIGKGDTRATYGYLGVSLYHFRTRDYRKKIKWRPAR